MSLSLAAGLGGLEEVKAWDCTKVFYTDFYTGL